MRTALAALALWAAVAAAAAEAPTLFDVAGVAGDDALNVRAAPSAEAEVVGALAFDAERIEVVALDAGGDWGRVNLGEASGWVAMRFLAAREDVWSEGALPATLRCFGTEPFWSVRPDGEQLVFETPDATVGYPLGSVLQRAAGGERRRIAIADGPQGRLTLVAAPGTCSDGMSDRAFGLTADLVVEGAGAPALYGGCCSIAP